MSAGQATAGRGPRALLRDRNFGPFLAGRLMSSCGMWIQNVAAAVLMFELTRSAFMVGAVSMVQFAGSLVLAVWAGALTDRVDRRLLLMAGRVLSGASVGLLSLLLVVRGVSGFGGPAVLLACVLVMGLGLAVSAPAMHAMVPALVRDEDLEQALALSSAAPSIARTVGPALGAGVLLLGGPALSFAVAATAHWTYVGVLTLVRPRPSPRPKRRPPVLGGLRYLVSDRNAGLLMLGVAALGVGADPVVTLTPPLADELGGGSELVGILASCFGGGALLITVTLRFLRQRLTLRTLGVAGFWTLAAGMALSAGSVNAAMASVGFAIAGSGFMMATVALNTRVQRRVPDELRGRVMALWAVAFLGSRPVAALLNGSIADLISIRAAFGVAGVITLAASLLARVSYTTGDGPLGPHDRR